MNEILRSVVQDRAQWHTSLPWLTLVLLAVPLRPRGLETEDLSVALLDMDHRRVVGG